MQEKRKPESVWTMLDHINPGSNVTEIMQTEECKLCSIREETGEGTMKMYQVMDGVFLMYNDFHMKKCLSEFQGADSLLCIEHCREGRMEFSNGDKSLYYIAEGDLRVDRRVHHQGWFYFPVCHYHGISIGFQTGRAEDSLREMMPGFSVDFQALAKKYCGDEDCAAGQT